MKNVEAIRDLICPVRELESKTVSVFNNSGKMLEKIESTSSYRFDECHNLLESEHSIRDVNTKKTINKFDSQNRLIESVFYIDGSLNQKREFSYDSKDSVVEIKYYDGDNNLQDTHRPVYTKDGLRVEETLYEPLLGGSTMTLGNVNFTIAPQINVKFSTKNIFKSKALYDTCDNLVEVSLYNHKNSLAGKIFVVYDSDNKPLEVRKFGDDRVILPDGMKRWQEIILDKLIYFYIALDTVYKLASSCKFKKAGQCLIYGAPLDETIFLYDEQKRIIEIKSFSTLDDGSGKTFKYDETGNRTEETLYGAGNSLSYLERHEYEYDSRSNWIKRKTLIKFPIGDKKRFEERTTLTYRSIKY